MRDAREVAHEHMAVACRAFSFRPHAPTLAHSAGCDAWTAAIEARDREVIEACAQEALGGYMGPAQKEAAARIRALAIPADGGKS